MALLSGRAALVTGGGRGIGEASARRLADNGAKVIVADMNLASAKSIVDDILKGGGEAKALEIDVAEFEKIPQKINEAKKLFGRIDNLVNVAGITRSTPIEEITLESWDRKMNIDLKSMFFITQAVFAVMKEQGYGKLVHMSSLAALRGGHPGGKHIFIPVPGQTDTAVYHIRVFAVYFLKPFTHGFQPPFSVL